MTVVPLFDGSKAEEELFLKTAMDCAKLAMVAVDLREKDHPISYMNRAFGDLSGYAAEEVVGKNCRFLQGTETSQDTISEIRSAIERGEEGYFEILNYRKDGTPFWNALHIGPVFDANGEPFMFFGSQRDITKEIEARELEQIRIHELRHRLSNLMAIVGVIVRNTKAGDGTKTVQEILEGRIAALSAATSMIYPANLSSGDRLDLSAKQVDLSVLVKTVIDPLGMDERFNVDGPTTTLGDRRATNVALVIHELATNSVKYGALTAPSGSVTISWEHRDGRVSIEWCESDGPAVNPPAREGMGSKLLRNLLSSSRLDNATLDYSPEGLVYRFDVGL